MIVSRRTPPSKCRCKSMKGRVGSIGEALTIAGVHLILSPHCKRVIANAPGWIVRSAARCYRPSGFAATLHRARSGSIHLVCQVERNRNNSYLSLVPGFTNERRVWAQGCVNDEHD